ncbi:MAG TPA: type 4a pilus biogenesis protein PilO [Gemmatimonadales bacterium]|nr:type 4a pilus biogenesis protein PilO [Gemmatimonadales bacterium]
MALGIPQDSRSQVMLLIIVACLAGGYFFWTKVQSPKQASIAATGREIDSLNAVVRKAKADLAGGSVESMRRSVERYRAALGLMRRLVPEQNEVPSLLENISNRAKVRGVQLGSFQPLSPEPGPPLALAFREPGDTGKKKVGAPAFDIYRYRLQVYGHYDQIGEFLADVSSLPRIMVPQALVLRAASQQTQKLVGDTLGALLEASFDLRTYVKRIPPSTSTAGGAIHARP